MKYKMKKSTIILKVWLIIFCLSLASGTLQPAIAEAEGGLRVLHEYDIRILMNGIYIDTDVMAEVSDERIAMLPLKAVFEAAGYTAHSDSTGKQEIIDLKNGETLILNITNGRAYLSDEYVGTFPYKIRQGVTLTTPEFFSLVDGIDAGYDVATHTVIISVTPARPNEVIFYNLGVKSIALPSGDKRDFTLNGGIAVPESKNNPVAIILHGSHPLENDADNRYDLGFSYLLKSLESQGFVALSLNVNLQYSFLDGEPVGQERLIAIVKETLEALKMANEGKNNGFGVDLTGKLDLSNLILIGHSRGGGGIFYVSDALENNRDVKVTGLLAIAPTDVFLEDLKITDIPTAFIVPEMDGDVVGLDGLTFFEILADIPDRANNLQLVYLYAANHNAFNEGVLPQDLGKIWYTGERKTMAAEDQRDFTSKYVMAFTQAVTTGKPLYKIASSLNQELFGYKAIVSNSLAGSKRVFSAHDSNLTANRAALEKVISSNMMTLNTAGLFHPGGISNELELLEISWNEQGAYVAFAVDEATASGGKMDLISLYLAPDSTSPLNNNKNQSFRVEIVDNTGNVAWYLLDSDTPALAHQGGEPIFEGEIFSTITPLGIIGIPTVDFNQVDLVDLTQIEEIRLHFSENASGSIMLRSVFVNMAAIIQEPETQEPGTQEPGTQEPEINDTDEQTMSAHVIILAALAGLLIAGVLSIIVRKKYKRNRK